MNEVRILNRQEIMQVLSLKNVIEGVEQAFQWKAEGKTDTFSMVFHEFVRGVADMDIKSGHLKPAGIYGMKFVSFFEANIKIQKSPLNAMITLYDDQNGFPIAILEGSCITGLRTSAAAATAAKHLARPNSETLLIVGAGHQCIYQAAAILETMNHIKTVIIHDAMNHDWAIQKADNLGKEIANELQITIPESIEVKAERNLQRAVEQSDIIITITPSRKPLIMKDWVRPGTHFSCVGSDMSGKQELDPQILTNARIFTDDTSQCQNVGEIELAWKSGVINGVSGELGEVISGLIKGRTSDEEITVFDSTGIAIQDLIAAKKAYDGAVRTNRGTIVSL